MRSAAWMLMAGLSISLGLVLVNSVAWAGDGALSTPPVSDAGVQAPSQPAVAPLEPRAAAPVAVSAAPTAPQPGDGKITLHIVDTPIQSVLQLLSKENEINIVASSNVTGNVSANLYKVTMETALDAILKANGLMYVRKGNFIFVYTKEEYASLQSAEAGVETILYKCNYVRASELDKLLRPHLSPNGKMAVTTDAEQGIPSGGDEAGGNTIANRDMIVITDTKSVVEKLRKLIAEIDVQPLQVVIEITILSVELKDEDHVGVQWELLSDYGFREVSGQVPASTTGNTSTAGAIPRNAVGLGSNDPGAAAKSSVMNIRTQGFISPTDAGLKLGFLSNHLQVFVHALESQGNTNVLANPRVAVLNKQRAEIIIGERLGFRTETSTETSTIQNIEFLDVGTQLRVRPFISSDGYVRMEIHPEQSTGHVDATGLPQEQTTEVTTNVIVKNNQTLVIGGLIGERAQKNHEQVPLLGSLPLLGYLFGNRDTSITRSELIILMTPHIVDHQKADAEARQQMADLRRRHRNLLSRMPIYGRAALARTHYEIGDQCMGNKWYLLADWYASWALHFNPTYQEAKLLKNRVADARRRERAAEVGRTTIEDLMMEEDVLEGSQTRR